MSLASQETRGLKVVMIFEMMGRPPKHITESLEKIIKDVDNEKGVSVTNKKINKPKEMEKQKGFYSSFAEIELEVDEILYLAILLFKYMPAHIEIISPELIALTNNGWNDILNELTRRLHAYDEVARILQMERAVLEKKLKEVLGQAAPQEKTVPGKKEAKKKTTKRKKKK